MFLLRLIHIRNFKPKGESQNYEEKKDNDNAGGKNDISPNIMNKETVNQIKNVTQEKKIKSKPYIEAKQKNGKFIKSLNELVELCIIKKEMKLKYELETNVNLVKFENCRIEIAFNDNLDKDFVKNLSTRLLEWTNQRWIISFSKKQGDISIKNKEKNKQEELIDNAKNSELYKTVLNYFPDAELIDVKTIKKDRE